MLPALSNAQHSGALEFYGEVIDRQSGEALKGAKVSVFLGANRLAHTTTSQSGRFQLFQPLKLNKDYVVNISKAGYPTKTIEIRGFVPADRLRDFKYGARLKLENLEDGEAYPTARIVYNYDEDRFRYTDFKLVDAPGPAPTASQEGTQDVSSKPLVVKTEVRVEPEEEAPLPAPGPDTTPAPLPTITADGGAHLLYRGDTLNRLDTLGQRQGDWTYFAGDSMVGYRSADQLLEGSYLNNKKVGNWVKYHPDGSINTKLLFIDDAFAGPYKLYHEGGSVLAEGQMNPETGSSTGNFRAYYSDGTLKEEYNFNEGGRRDGRQVVYYPSGKMAVNATMKNGELDGYTTKYQESGAVYSQAEYAAGTTISESMYAEPGNFADAFFDAFLEQEDSIVEAVLATAAEVSQVELQYESLLAEKNRTIQEKEAALSQTREILNLSQLENAVQLEQIDRQRLVNTFALIALALVVLLLIGMLVRYREKKRNAMVLQNKNELIQARNQEIMSSIRYAQRIQDAILPPVEQATAMLGDAFVLFRPKDIVSGDFYWIRQTEQKVLFAVVDCTGHGVPGAMVSMVGHNELNRAVVEFGLTAPGAILNKLNELVQETFHTSDGEGVNDGMDLALAAYDPALRTIEFSGANNPMYIVRAHGSDGPAQGSDTLQVAAVNGAWHLLEVKGTRRPIGPHTRKGIYENHAVQLQPNDRVYLFSDGYADQFGGATDAAHLAGGKKFKYKAFRSLLLSIQDKPMIEQQQLLNQSLIDWMGPLEQLDDISVIGMKVQ